MGPSAGLEPAISSLQMRRFTIKLRRQIKWRSGESNPRHIACKAIALPTELHPHELWYNDQRFFQYKSYKPSLYSSLVQNLSRNLGKTFFLTSQNKEIGTMIIV